MSPKLRVTVSSSSSSYPPTSPISVNSTKPQSISTPGFEGKIWVFVKDYEGEHKDGEGKEYFEKEWRNGMSFGIVVRGKFKQEVGVDEIVFGNVFERPIRDCLPWGTSVATKFLYFMDPVMELDIYADQPWALSPALATMNSLSLSKGEEISEDIVVKENALKYLKSQAPDVLIAEGDEKTLIGTRKKWLSHKSNREKIKLEPETVVGMEFANGLLDFNTLSATLPPPFSLSFPLLKFWDGQPVTYVCQKRANSGQNPVGQQVFWSVGFEIIDEDARRQLEERNGKASASEPWRNEQKSHGQEEQISDDID
ncbi:uncharacterized protein L203_102917 [Cryptococcus depauperatus CBS 7841]|uniref:Domain of unknown function at the cortex 1 domain-containing protein n=1 Tax=Cryptococcus depauperatus CBS 7841 TaxID=1295531 RepID=A0A1E3IBM3_9TREE|nr:hypothetical protein L203_04721 [Cryptococcus depauperatus CBS 7841]